MENGDQAVGTPLGDALATAGVEAARGRPAQDKSGLPRVEVRRQCRFCQRMHGMAVGDQRVVVAFLEVERCGAGWVAIGGICLACRETRRAELAHTDVREWQGGIKFLRVSEQSLLTAEFWRTLLSGDASAEQAPGLVSTIEGQRARGGFFCHAPGCQVRADVPDATVEALGRTCPLLYTFLVNVTIGERVMVRQFVCCFSHVREAQATANRMRVRGQVLARPFQYYPLITARAFVDREPGARPSSREEARVLYLPVAPAAKAASRGVACSAVPKLGGVPEVVALEINPAELETVADVWKAIGVVSGARKERLAAHLSEGLTPDRAKPKDWKYAVRDGGGKTCPLHGPSVRSLGGLMARLFDRGREIDPTFGSSKPREEDERGETGASADAQCQCTECHGQFRQVFQQTQDGSAWVSTSDGEGLCGKCMKRARNAEERLHREAARDGRRMARLKDRPVGRRGEAAQKFGPGGGKKKQKGGGRKK